MDVIKELSLIGLVPVIKIDDAKDAAPLAHALDEGGLPCAEVTFRTAAAAEAIAEMVKACPDMLVGAGTVLTTAQVDEAVAAGAKFIVSPGLNPTVVKYCVERDIPVMPGINNPSGIEQAMEHNCRSKADYFPSYEIMMDELRDYRFYAEDMCHPTKQAVDYIRERFLSWALPPSEQPVLEENIRLLKRRSHIN